MSIIRSILNSARALVNNTLPTTGSNTFIGTQTMSGSIIPAVDNTYDLGSATYQWRDIYVSSGSLYIDGTKVLGSTNQELQITTDEGQSIKILEAGSDNIILQSSDGDIQLKSSGGGNLLFDPTTGLIDIRGTLQIQDGQKITSSGGNSVVIGDDLVVTGSINITGNVNGINLTTLNTTANKSATTGSNIFNGNQIITGSMYMTGDLVVYGTSSLQNITASATTLGTNTIILNSASPAFRFAGISVIDSGSSQATGSLFWDSENNRWIYQKESGSSYDGGMLISGPRNTSGLGNEESMTNNRVVMGIGGDHISSSGMWTNGNSLSIPSNLEVTGSIKGQILSTNGVVSGSSQVSFTVIVDKPTLISGSSQVDVMSTTNITRLATTGSNTFNGTETITGSLLVNGGSTTGRFVNTSSTSNSNVQLGNDAGTNQAGVALFGSQYASSGQYRANGAYFYSNLAGGLTLHAEGANPMYLATNNTTAITINSSQNVNFSGKIGVGIATPTATKLSLGTGVGAKLMVYDNGSGVYSGIGQDMAEGNSTDLFAHGSGNLGFITFGKLGTNGTTYTEWARFDTAGNLNIKGGQIQQNGTGIIQMVPIGPTATNIAYTATINGQYTIGSTSIPSNARWLLADIFITANISDHQNFMLTRFNFGTQKNWVDTRGNNPASEFGNLTQGDVALLTYNGESDGYTPNYGVWKSSVMVPSVGRTLWINNHGNSNSNGYLYFIVRAYSL